MSRWADKPVQFVRSRIPRAALPLVESVLFPGHESNIERWRAQPSEMQPGRNAGPIERAYFAHHGRLAHKWHQYLPLYDRYFAPYQHGRDGKPIRMLEIGVSHGGSLALWRQFFGPDAVIFGVDIDERCRVFDGEHGSVRIGSQADSDFLRRVVAEMGGLDIVLDDGGHIASHMTTSFDCLFPMLADGGLYVAEDVCCAYWRSFGGGYRRPGSFVEKTKTLIDDLHRWTGSRAVANPAVEGMVSGIHIHDSLFVFEKNPAPRPVHSAVGTPSF
jgi:hypothetical protein